MYQPQQHITIDMGGIVIYILRISQFTISGLSLLGICLTAASTGQAQWVQSGSNMYYTKGNISVGTTTPFGQFTIGNYTLVSPY